MVMLSCNSALRRQRQEEQVKVKLGYKDSLKTAWERGDLSNIEEEKKRRRKRKKNRRRRRKKRRKNRKKRKKMEKRGWGKSP